ncbi:BTB/POZ and MATH domain-containing protein 2-like [Dorcoceras hygrometricum]|uniref:BTB/POZ and MATH domain-containing protein 2-like n=1 Tax=Dorcoceras hygrometricum TaxID=472368 RepID=A0A2Z7BXQ4_9LAMI|nr:BTB/POZ and MATH domain-containing protein 2-like [Dorcoceras hygrometricum]
MRSVVASHAPGSNPRDSDSSSSSSSSSDSEQEEVHCLMANQPSDDEVFDFSNTEFTREDLINALTELVHEYKKISQTFEEFKAENMDLKNSSVEPSTFQLGETDSLQIELSFSAGESSSEETCTQSNMVYDKFKRMNFVKASVIHDTCESVRCDDQISEQLNQKGKAGIGYVRPENSKSSWLKNRLDREKAKAGSKSFVQNQQRRGSRKVKSEWRKVQLRRDLNGQNTNPKLKRSHHIPEHTLMDFHTGKTVKVIQVWVPKGIIRSGPK